MGWAGSFRTTRGHRVGDRDVGQGWLVGRTTLGESEALSRGSIPGGSPLAQPPQDGSRAPEPLHLPTGSLPASFYPTLHQT